VNYEFPTVAVYWFGEDNLSAGFHFMASLWKRLPPNEQQLDSEPSPTCRRLGEVIENLAPHAFDFGPISARNGGQLLGPTAGAQPCQKVKQIRNSLARDFQFLIVLNHDCSAARALRSLRKSGPYSTKQATELFPVQATVPEDFAHQPRPNRFAGVYGNHGRAPVRVAQEVMAATNSHQDKPAAFERPDYLWAGQRW
jgi:hypothetical protein